MSTRLLTSLNPIEKSDVVVTAPVYVDRMDGKKMNDPYKKEFTKYQESIDMKYGPNQYVARLQGWRIWQQGWFDPFVSNETTSGYSPKLWSLGKDSDRATGNHAGIDIQGAGPGREKNVGAGAEVVFPTDALVIFAGWTGKTEKRPKGSGYGYRVEWLCEPHGIIMSASHLEYIDPLIKKNQRYKRGESIGKEGGTGDRLDRRDSHYAHVHLECADPGPYDEATEDYTFIPVLKIAATGTTNMDPIPGPGVGRIPSWPTLHSKGYFRNPWWYFDFNETGTKPILE